MATDTPDTSFRAPILARRRARRAAPRVAPTALVAALNYTFAVSVAVILWDADRTLQRIAAIVVLVTVVPAVVWMRQMLTRAAVHVARRNWWDQVVATAASAERAPAPPVAPRETATPDSAAPHR